MKRLFDLIFLATAASALLASCQQENLEPAHSSDGEGYVSITLNLEGKISTKADAATPAMTVYYEIYEDSDCDNRLYPSSGDAFPVSGMENAVKVGNDGKAILEVELLKGKEYWFVFWAMEDGAPYTWTSLTDISMNWSETGNADRDAFYGSVAVTGGKTAAVTLVRPFAQLNIGTSVEEMAYDPADAGSDIPCVVTSWAQGYEEYHPFRSSQIEITGEFADRFNAATAQATASASLGKLTFKADGLYGTLEQDDHLALGQTGSFVHVAMNYILPVSDAVNGIKGTADVTAGFMIGDATAPVSHTITYVPLEANKRTNIVGGLFTSDGEIIVEMSSWETSDIVVDLWDGSVDEVTPEENDEYVIETAEQLAWIAQQVNTGADDFKGKTIRLAADIDLAGNIWTPIGAAEGNVDSPYAFRGTFDGAKDQTAVKSGENKECWTISNMTVKVQDAGAGLFGLVQGGTVKNLRLSNVDIENADKAGGSCSHSGSGAVIGTATYGAIIENVHVADVTVASNHYVGGLAGYLAGQILNCSAENVTLTAVPDNYSGEYDNGDKVGGILGYQQGPGNSPIQNEIKGCVVRGIDISGTRDMGGIVGYAFSAPESCSVADLTIEADQALLPKQKDVNCGPVVGRKAPDYTGDETQNKADTAIEIRQKISSGAYLDLMTPDTYELQNAEGLYWLAEQVNVEGDNFKGKTIVLVKDVDLKGEAWTPIGNGTTPFMGTFEGVSADALVTVSNFKVETARFGGLFGNSTSGNFADFAIKNADITSNHYAGAVVGYTQGAGYIRNVNVSESVVSAVPELVSNGTKYDNGDKAGAVAGYISYDAASGEYRVEECTVASVKINAYRDAGGLVGTLNGSNAFVVDNTLNDVDVTVDRELDLPYVDDSAANSAEVVGRHIGGTVENNTCTDVTVTINYSLKELVSEENAVVTLKAGEYKLPSGIADGVTIIGVEGETVFTGTTGISGENVTVKNVEFRNDEANGRSLTGHLKGTVFENCHFNSDQGARYCYAQGDVVFKGCTFGNEDCIRGIHFDAGEGTVTLIECKLYGFNAMGGSLEKVTFNSCEFLHNNNYNVLNMYNVYEFNDCTFDPSMNCDCADNGVVAAFNGCSYTDGKDIKTLVRFDKDPATCTITFDGVPYQQQ